MGDTGRGGVARDAITHGLLVSELSYTRHSEGGKASEAYLCLKTQKGELS